ncbi:MAG: 4-(cytidine 5'-diphospho)-2-C-methyl-D-erythritol kinase [Candidatus Nanopelagicales bacterium]
MPGPRLIPVPSAASVMVRVPAKVNLQLSVGNRRRDGYHHIVTVFHAVGLYDEVTVTEARPGAGISVRVEGERVDGVPVDRSNLAWAAAESLAAAADVKPDVSILLRKGIPVAGGMAGGSADAAAVLVACDALWRTGMDRGALAVLAATLGSDVPFALKGGTAVGTGRGERLTPALAKGQLHWVFAVAETGLSTAAVYRECDKLRGDTPVLEPRVNEAVMGALRSGDAVALGRALTNDLQRAAVALRPQLSQVLELGLDHGALGAVVSGSGPTCAFLVRDEEAALDTAVSLTASGVCRTVKRAVGPVHGARVVDGTDAH